MLVGYYEIPATAVRIFKVTSWVFIGFITQIFFTKARSRENLVIAL